MAADRVPKSRRRRRLLLVGLLVAIGLAAFGCTSVVRPPRDPVDPVAVFLVRDERHLGLVLPLPTGELVEYGYGDWDWYALGHDRWYHVFDTVLWPTQGTLSRREIAARDQQGLLRAQPWQQVHPISVSAPAARALQADLDAQFARHQDQQHYNSAWRMVFVPHDDGYWFLYNCNDAVAGWLRALDCSVSWVPIRLGLTVAAP